jgi:hypothetical protein
VGKKFATRGSQRYDMKNLREAMSRPGWLRDGVRAAIGEEG